MEKSLAVVAKVFSNTLIFLCKNMSVFYNAKATHNFSAKNTIAIFQDRNFNVTLTNSFVKF